MKNTKVELKDIELENVNGGMKQKILPNKLPIDLNDPSLFVPLCVAKNGQGLSDDSLDSAS